MADTNLRTLAEIIVPGHSLIPHAEIDRLIREARTAAPIVACPPECVVIEKAKLREIEAGVNRVNDGLIVLTTVEHALLLQAQQQHQQEQKQSGSKPDLPPRQSVAGEGKGKKPTKANQWVQRFLKLDLAQIERTCPPSVKMMFSKSVVENLSIQLPGLSLPRCVAPSSSIRATKMPTPGRPRMSLAASLSARQDTESPGTISKDAAISSLYTLTQSKYLLLHHHLSRLC